MSTEKPSGNEFFEEDEQLSELAKKFMEYEKGVTRRPVYTEPEMFAVLAHLGRTVKDLEEARDIARKLYNFCKPLDLTGGWTFPDWVKRND